MLQLCVNLQTMFLPDSAHFFVDITVVQRFSNSVLQYNDMPRGLTKGAGNGKKFLDILLIWD